MWRKFVDYLLFRNAGAADPKNINLKIMHRINRLSIWMFLVALVVLIIRYLF